MDPQEAIDLLEELPNALNTATFIFESEVTPVTRKEVIAETIEQLNELNPTLEIEEIVEFQKLDLPTVHQATFSIVDNKLNCPDPSSYYSEGFEIITCVNPAQNSVEIIARQSNWQDRLVVSALRNSGPLLIGCMNAGAAAFLAQTAPTVTIAALSISAAACFLVAAADFKRALFPSDTTKSAS